MIKLILENFKNFKSNYFESKRKKKTLIERKKEQADVIAGENT